jgi:Transposase domain (DUF772)
VIDADLAALGFEGMLPATTGRPAYYPATLLKIYLYGYLNRIPSSRRPCGEIARPCEPLKMRGFSTLREPVERLRDKLGIRPEHGFVGLARPVFVKTRTLGLLLRGLREIAAARRLLPRRLTAAAPLASRRGAQA